MERTVSEAIAQAVVLHQAGRLAEAEPIYRRVLAVDPDQPDALHLLGVLAQQTGQSAVAVELIGRALRVRPHEAPFHSNLGNAWKALGDLDAAIVCYRRALELDPALADAHQNLGTALQESGNLDEASACFQRALELRPEFVEAGVSLSAALTALRRPAESAACCRRMLQVRPDSAALHANLGTAQQALGNLEEAISCYRRALELNPHLAEAHTSLGSALQVRGLLDDALSLHRRAVELNPRSAWAHNNLGTAWQALGNIEVALACYRRAMTLQPGFAEAHSNLLLTLQYLPGITAAQLAAAHAEYEALHARPLRRYCPPPAARNDRPLRLGFVSADFACHPVGYFLLGVLEHLDRGQCTTTLYSDRVGQDHLTVRLQRAADAWRDVSGATDEALAQRIVADRIDVLFDLAGHTARNRLLVFARKPAPLQVTWAGYVGTTGLAAMDCVLADRHHIPPQAEPFYCERVLRMPDGYVCYAPPDDAPPVSPLPAMERGYVTLGCLNQPGKIGPPVMARWAEILRRLPAARLLLAGSGPENPSIARRLMQGFREQGIDPARLAFCGRMPHAAYLGQYQHIDMALDPFPYSGGLTTCEALWMGVPVITCPGATFAGRHALSHLATVGLTETIAADPADYVERTLALAGDLSRLAALRAELRPRMAAAPLCDGSRFAANLLRVLRDAARG